MDYLEKLNSTFTELMKDLIRVFPDDQEMQVYNFGLNAAFMLDDTIIYTAFKDHILQYEEKIMVKDESFFLTQDYNEFKGDGDADAIIKKLKSSWTKLSDSDKEVVWRYFKVMTKLSKKLFDNST